MVLGALQIVYLRIRRVLDVLLVCGLSSGFLGSKMFYEDDIDKLD